MRDELIEERDRLRARLFGPASGRVDTAAARRLTELENRLRPAAGPLGDAPSTDDAASDPATVDDASSGAGADVGIGDEFSLAPEHRRWSRRALLLVWAASLAAVAVLASVSTAAAVRVSALLPDARHVATIRVDEGAAWSPGYSAGEVDVFSEYLGLTPVVDRWHDEEGPVRECLTVYVSTGITRDSTTFSGSAFSGCGGGGFPASVVIPSEGREIPDALTNEFGPAAAVQFVARDGAVEVYTDDR